MSGATPSARPLLIYVSGRPGSGKSTLARELAAAMWFPLLSADAVGMGMLETAAAGAPRDWAAPGGGTKIGAVYALVETALALGVSLVLELSFRRGLDEPRVRELQGRARVVNVHCEVPIALALERFREREVGDRARFRDAWSRHRPDFRPLGSAQHYVEQMERGTFDWSVFEPLDLGLPRMTVDTSDGYRPDLDTIVGFCRGSTDFARA